MRILVIANLRHTFWGGAENQVARLVEAWMALGHHVEVAGHRIPSGRIAFGDADVRIHRIGISDQLGRVGRALTYLFSLAWLLRRRRADFDVIYVRGLGDGAISICFFKAAGWVGLPMVACPINARGAGDVNFIRSIPGWRWIIAVINKHCDAINLIAPAIEGDLQEAGISRPKLYRTPNGIPLKPMIVRNQLPFMRRLVWTGRLAHQKGLDLLFGALARVVKGGIDFRLDVVGDGPDLPVLHALCRKLGLDSQIEFKGAIGGPDIRDVLAVADVFVLPSRYEGMSNAVLEALEAGLPVLLTRCGGIDTYVDSSIGWVCEPAEPDKLFEALIEMFRTPDAELLAKGRRARKLVEDRFEIGLVARRNAEMLAEVSASKYSG